MNLFVISAARCLALLAFLAPAANASSVGQYLPAVDNYIVPAYRALTDATVALETRAVSFCRAPTQAGFDSLRESFHESMDAWQWIQTVRFGPVVYLTRSNRYQMWPDKRGTVAKHLRLLLASKDPEALEPERFATGSVAVQGLSALEILLFDSHASPEDFSGKNGAYACKVLLAITANLARMSTRVTANWIEGDDAYRQYIANAPEGNAVFEDERSVGAQLLNDLRTALEFANQHKLSRPLGENIERARPKRSESWRSRRSTENIRINLEGARRLYRSAFAPRLSGTALDAEIEAGFDGALAAADGIPMPLSEAVTDPAGRARVEALRDRVSALEKLLASPAAEALDLPMGFNSLDGD